MNLIALHLNFCIVSIYTNKNQAFNCTYKTFKVPCEKPKTVSFASSMIKYIVVPISPSKFVVKIICWIYLGSASRTCCLIKSVTIILQ